MKTLLPPRPLKPTKFAATYKVTCRTEAATAVNVTIDGETECYGVAAIDASRFQVSGPRGIYTVNRFRGECGCEGGRRGFACRHLRLVNKMVARGDVAPKA